MCPNHEDCEESEQEGQGEEVAGRGGLWGLNRFRDAMLVLWEAHPSSPASSQWTHKPKVRAVALSSGLQHAAGGLAAQWGPPAAGTSLLGRCCVNTTVGFRVQGLHRQCHDTTASPAARFSKVQSCDR